MYIKILENDDSKIFIKKIDILNENPFVSEWLDEKNVKLYLLYDDDVLKSFVLLNRLNRDPLNKHTRPYYLNYIYTFEEYRKQNFADRLLSEIKKTEEITAFCTDDIAHNLFKKNGYILNDYDELYSFPIYRYP